ncbi:hypothetical protein [Paragemmobacter ruber]|uniref:Flagellar FliJ protein n=1 Tax=Paragemmobacter ruber TaxID=1985673 RepID=A0ABW9Y4A8_9RHOB|nr:hypothetical protein [Rhodobacter ruber]NBE07378.1 hypothetical protein [Rhodobacter ruber]
MEIMTIRNHRLLQAAALVRDFRLGQVAQAHRALLLSRTRAAALAPEPVSGADPALHAAALQHQIWAEGRRRTLESIMAYQEQVLSNERDLAARAIARQRVIERLFMK